MFDLINTVYQGYATQFYFHFNSVVLNLVNCADNVFNFLAHPLFCPKIQRAIVIYFYLKLRLIFVSWNSRKILPAIIQKFVSNLFDFSRLKN